MTVSQCFINESIIEIVYFYNSISPAMETYRVSIDSENHFEVESCLIKVGENDARIVNLRSVKGHIGIDFNFLSDEKLKELVKTYQRTTDNVELLNVLSRQYNGWNCSRRVACRKRLVRSLR